METFALGITGISGSGKTFFIQKLKEQLKDLVAIISFDDYYKPYEDQAVDAAGITNFDLPDALFYDQFHQDLNTLLQGHPVVIKKYHFENYEAPESTEIIAPAPIIIAEGLFVFHFPEIDHLLNYRIFVESDLNLSLNRRLSRDTSERGIPEERSLYQWHHHVMPAYEQYILPHKTRCNMVIENQGPYLDNLHSILHQIKEKAHPSIAQQIWTP